MKVLFIKIVTELSRRIYKYSDDINKDMENITKFHTEVRELKNTITEPKNALKSFSGRLHEAEV